MQKRRPIALADKTNLSSSAGKSLIKTPPKLGAKGELPSSDVVAFDDEGNIVSSEERLEFILKEVIEENKKVEHIC